MTTDDMVINAFAYLVAIDVGAVEMPVPEVESLLDGSLHFARLGLPGPQAQEGHLFAIVQRYTGGHDVCNFTRKICYVGV